MYEAYGIDVSPINRVQTFRTCCSVKAVRTLAKMVRINFFLTKDTQQSEEHLF